MNKQLNVDAFDVIEDDFSDTTSGIQVSKKTLGKPSIRIREKYETKRAVFGKSANYLTNRGFRVVNEVPEFYYVTQNVMVCPPLDGLESSEIYSFETGYDCLIK